jgi:signal transduction histidine kinase
VWTAGKERTEIFYDEKEIVENIVSCIAGARGALDICASSAAPSIAVLTAPFWKSLKDAEKRGVKVRFLTEINRSNIRHCNELAKIAEVRHLDGLRGGLALSETVYMATVNLFEGKPVPVLIYSTAKEVVEQQHYVFHTLWSMAQPAQDKIAGIEKGIEPEFIEIITEQAKAPKIFAGMLKSAEKKVLLLLPHAGSLEKAHEAGVIEVISEKARKKGFEARMISPMDDAQKKQLPAGISALAGHESSMTLLVVDDRKCFLVEEGEKERGFILHTNSPAAVRTFQSFFDIQWHELAFIDRLVAMGRQRDEFISVAAHELRNPITPIMLFVDGLKEEFGDRPEVAGIVRNTKRLQMLIQDILDVSKVDNRNLALKKSRVSLNDLVGDACSDARNQAKGGVEIVFRSSGKIYVEADPARISQVVYNLLDNALKFTKGRITVTAKARGKVAEVKVKDGGAGIDARVLPRLFEKFVTASDKGTGIGLYLCKAIVVSHGGTIWGENNKRGPGATFSFTLPRVT